MSARIGPIAVALGVAVCVLANPCAGQTPGSAPPGAQTTGLAAGRSTTHPATGSAEAAALENWLKGKEVIEVTFAGEHMDPQDVRAPLQLKVKWNDWDFRMSRGEGGGANRAFVEVCMKVTPENVRRLLALQAELDPLGYRLDAKATRIWSFEGDAETRAKARKLMPEVLASVEKGIRESLPDAQFREEKGGIRYDIPGTEVTGSVRVSEIAATKYWDLPVSPDMRLHLPRLGLMVMQYYRPGRAREKDVSPQQEAIRKAFRQAVGPLLKLEPGAVVWPGASVWPYKAYWLESNEPGEYVKLMLTRLPIGSLPEALFSAETPPLDCPAIVVTTYRKDSLWNTDRKPFKPLAGVQNVDSNSSVIVIQDKPYRFSPADLKDVVRLLGNPEGTIQIHRIHGPTAGQEELAKALLERLNSQLLPAKESPKPPALP